MFQALLRIPGQHVSATFTGVCEQDVLADALAEAQRSGTFREHHIGLVGRSDTWVLTGSDGFPAGYVYLSEMVSPGQGVLV